jgi:hypothetical protein
MPNERTYGFREDDATSLVQSIETSQRPYREIEQRPSCGEFVVILDAALAAATHSLTGASSCLATVCEWDSTDSEYAEGSKQITVWNHSEKTSHVEDTFGYARWIDNHWHFFGDCEAMASR